MDAQIEVRRNEFGSPDRERIKGLVAEYAYYLEKEGFKCKGYFERIKQLVRLGANLLDPEDVKSTIAKQKWKNGTKNLACYAYRIFVKMAGLQWIPPKYRQEETLPFIPEEAELDQLIAGFRSRRIIAFLQTLKEAFADPGEALNLRWVDMSIQNSTLTINQPVKGHNPRQLQVSTKLITMLNSLPRKSERIFPICYDSIHAYFITQRRKIADRLENPRILSISFNTFRHWGATMTYHYTRDILLVQKLLGHKNITSTMKYTRLIQFKDNEFDVATASDVEEAKNLLKSGFEYITERNGVMLFRKPKRFGSNRTD